MRAAMAEAIGHVSAEIESLRALIAELRPPALDQLGLEPALASLVQRTATTSGLEIAADVRLGGDGDRLQPELETTVYRIVQEALTNVAKHARATTVAVAVREADGCVDVRVADDGAGLGAGPRSSGGFGLVGMRERVELAGGELRIEGGRDGGTVVRARLPVP
jgi:signal transduction histidine kinase